MAEKYVVDFSEKSFLLRGKDDFKNMENAKMFRQQGGKWYKNLKGYGPCWVFSKNRKETILKVLNENIFKNENSYKSTTKEQEIDDIVKHFKDNTKQKKYHRAISANNSDEDEDEDNGNINETKEIKERQLPFEEQLINEKKVEKLKQFAKEKERFDKAFHIEAERKEKERSEIEKKSIKTKGDNKTKKETKIEKKEIDQPKEIKSSKIIRRSNGSISNKKNKQNKNIVSKRFSRSPSPTRQKSNQSSHELQKFYKAFSKNPKLFKKVYKQVKNSKSEKSNSSSDDSEDELDSSHSENSDNSENESEKSSDSEMGSSEENNSNNEFQSSEENSSSSDDYPLPESPYKKKLKRLDKKEPIFTKLKEIEKKLYKMEMDKKKRK